MKNTVKVFVALLSAILLICSFSACNVDVETSKAGTEGLEYFPLPDGTWGVAMGRTQYLEEVVIPTSYEGERVTQIMPNAFRDATNLKNVLVQSSVTTIGANAFVGCEALTDLSLPFLGKAVDDEENATLAYLFGYSVPASLTSVTLTGDTSIGNNAFSNCVNLTSLSILGTVQCIGNNAFSGCTGLTNISISDSVTAIGDSAFSGCTNLTSITIPNGVPSIGDSVFYNCSGLTRITIPDSVTSIGDNTFRLCWSLRTIFYSGTDSQWEAIQISAGNTSINTVTRYYYSETAPTTVGNYWRYVDGIPTPW